MVRTPRPAARATFDESRARTRRLAALVLVVIAATTIGAGYVFLEAAQQRRDTGDITRVAPGVTGVLVATPEGSTVNAPEPTAEASGVPKETFSSPASTATPAETVPTTSAPTPAARVELSRPPAGLFVRSTALGTTYGRILRLSLDSEAAPQMVGNLTCDRVHFAAGHGICLTAHRGVLTTYEAILFGEDGTTYGRLALNGIPSRARVSADGTLGAVTVFVSGHSYAGGAFSTQTSIVDLRSGVIVVNDLERFRATKDGTVIDAADVNIWGVTFAANPSRFFVTLATGGHFYLAEGDLSSSTLRVMYDGLECPSLSPDGTRIAFKRRIIEGSRLRWQPAVLDLASLSERLLPESRNVDDQIEWLDNGNVLYALPEKQQADTAATDLWVALADGSATPRLLVHNAESPAVQHP